MGRVNRTAGLMILVGGLAAAIVAGLLVAGEPRGSSRNADHALAAEDPWSALRRALKIPHISPDEGCPRTWGGRDAPRVGVTLGRGPAYPVVGMPAPPPDPRGVMSLHGDLNRGGRYYHKTLWAVRPSYRQRVLVRGRRLDGKSSIRFKVGHNRPRRELKIPLGPGERWRYAVSASLFPGNGCFGFQVDGTNFSRVVVFRVVGAK